MSPPSDRPAPFKLALPKNFTPGSKLVVEGTHFKGEEDSTFAIDFECGDEGNVALHLSPRFKEKVFVANNYKDGVWDKAVKSETMSLEPGSKFKMEVECAAGEFKVALNGKSIKYKHRSAPETITQVQIYCDVIISEITLTSPSGESKTTVVNQGPFGMPSRWTQNETDAPQGMGCGWGSFGVSIFGFGAANEE